MKGDLRVFFIGTGDGMEATLVPEKGYDFYSVPSTPLRRSFDLRNLLIPFILLAGVIKSVAILKKNHVSAVLATGGFVCVPVLYAARLIGLKTFMQEQNSYPGITTKLFARRTETLFTSYPGVERYLKGEVTIEQTGNPLRSGFGAGNRIEAMEYFNLDNSKKTILVFGGSQGAKAINDQIAAECLAVKAQDNVQLLWQTGKTDLEKYRTLFDRHELPGRVLPFVERMDLAYAAADIVVCRSGALTLSELAACGKPSIQVPYPFAAENHQEFNARVFEGAGAAVMILQTQLKDRKLFGSALKLLGDEAWLKRMSHAAAKLHSEGASDRIAARIIAEVGN